MVGKELILAYADDIVILGNIRQEITETTSELLVVSKKNRAVYQSGNRYLHDILVSY